MKKIKVLHVTWSGNKAGALRDIIQQQRKDKHIICEVVFCTDTNGIHANDIQKMGFKIYDLGMNNKYNFLQSLIGGVRLIQIIRKGNYNILHFQEAILPFVFIFAGITKGKAKLILHNRGEFLFFFRNKIKRLGVLIKRIFYFTFVNLYADLVLTTSKFIFTDTIKTGINKSKLRIIYNATDINELKEILFKKNELKNKLRKELGLEDNIKIIGTVSRLVPLKRIDFLIKIFKNLKNIKKHLVIVGNGEEELNLKQLTADLKINDYVSFWGFRRDAKEILAGFDAFVLPTCGEAFCMAVLEAIILRVPVFVMKDGGGLTEFVINGINGFICSDFNELEDKVNNYLLNPYILDQNWPYDEFIKQFKIEDYVDSIKKYYLKLT